MSIGAKPVGAIPLQPCIHLHDQVSTRAGRRGGVGLETEDTRRAALRHLPYQCHAEIYVKSFTDATKRPIAVLGRSDADAPQWRHRAQPSLHTSVYPCHSKAPMPFVIGLRQPETGTLRQGSNARGRRRRTLRRMLPSGTLEGTASPPHSAAMTSTSTVVGSAPGRTGMRTDSRPSLVPMVGT